MREESANFAANGANGDNNDDDNNNDDDDRAPTSASRKVLLGQLMHDKRALKLMPGDFERKIYHYCYYLCHRHRLVLVQTCGFGVGPVRALLVRDAQSAQVRIKIVSIVVFFVFVFLLILRLRKKRAMQAQLIN